MPISHGHKPFVYEDFIPEMEASTLINAVKIKQNLYDEGRTKVQDYYDKVSSLPLVRDADKAYANQELNKIFSIIQNNAGSADFSSPQAVRSFIDIAKPLERDQTMINAIQSSAEYKSRLEQLEEIKTKHPEKYSKENEWELMRDIEAWSNDPNAGVKLSSKQYVPYADMTGKYLKLQKEVKADIETKFALQLKNGQIEAKDVERLTAAKFKEALQATMTPMELQQLQIHSDYKSANTTREDKYKNLFTTYKEGYENNLLYSQTKGIENHPDAKGRTAEDFAADAQSYKDAMEGLLSEDGTVNEEEVDRRYSGMLLDGFQNQIANTFAYEQSKSKLYTNPIQMKNMDLANAMKMEAVKHKNAMEAKGLILDAATQTYVKAPWYEAVKKVDAPAKAPTIFNSDSSVINTALFEKLKANTSMTYKYQDITSNFSKGFIDRMRRKVGIDPDNAMRKEDIAAITIIKNPATNAVSYKVSLANNAKGSSGYTKTVTIVDEETGGAIQAYLNGDASVYQDEVTTTNQKTAEPAPVATEVTPELLKQVESGFAQDEIAQ
jgi:hypothetical protein